MVIIAIAAVEILNSAISEIATGSELVTLPVDIDEPPNPDQEVKLLIPFPKMYRLLEVLKPNTSVLLGYAARTSNGEPENPEVT